MTATVNSRPQSLREMMEAKHVPAPEKKDDTLGVIKRLTNYMMGGEHRSTFIRALVYRLVSVVALTCIPFMTGEAINVLGIPGPNQHRDLSIWAILAMISAMVFFGFSTVAERSFASLATGALYRLQRALFDHIQTLSLSFFDRQPIGELMSRVTNDTETVALFYEQAVAQIIRALFQIVLIVLVMFVVNWQLTIAALLIVPIMLAITAVIQRVASPAFTKLQEELGDLSGFQEETISSSKVIISSRRQDWAVIANNEQAGRVYDVATRAFFTSLLQFPVTSLMSMLMIIVVLVIGSLMVLAGSVEFGVVVAFMGYAGLLASPLAEMANLTATTLNAVAGGRRVFSIMDEEPTVVDAPDASEFDFEGGHVVFDDVDFSYVPGRMILHHNTFEAKPGQMIGVCGPTGAGKSTIINILTRYYDIDSGAIYIDDQNLAELTQTSLRLQIGSVLQEAFLFSDTVMNNLLYARVDATEDDCIEAAKQANAHEFIMNLPQGYETMMTERGANLSQGQRQMVTIARAMVADPKILILDEATSNVDTRTERLIQEGLQRLMSGRTSFVIAHRLSTIRPAHKILVVNAGEIVEQGSHDELMAQKGFYYTLYMSQFKGKAPDGADKGSSEFIST